MIKETELYLMLIKWQANAMCGIDIKFSTLEEGKVSLGTQVF